MRRRIYKKLRAIKNNLKLAYFPVWKAPYIWVKNRKLSYKVLPFEHARKYKRSDTMFVLGSGPSLGKISPKQWEHIAEYDSFGINYAFLTGFAPTFYSLEDSKRPWFRKHMEKTFSFYRKKFSETVWCINDKHLYRLIHPRFVPQFFPENPVCCCYDFPHTIKIEGNRPFKAEDFNKGTLVYRGSLSVAIDLIDRIGYRNIVLLGVDLHTCTHFFDDYEIMKPYVEENYKDVDCYKGQYGNPSDYAVMPYESMLIKENKHRTLEEYLYALNDFYFKPKGIKLYVGNEDNMLCPKIEAYDWQVSEVSNEQKT